MTETKASSAPPTTEVLDRARREGLGELIDFVVTDIGASNAEALKLAPPDGSLCTSSAVTSIQNCLLRRGIELHYVP